MNLFRRKSVTDLQAEAESDHSLKRALGADESHRARHWRDYRHGHLCAHRHGCRAERRTGCGAFLRAGRIASVFAALCYSEFASLVPMAGSAYTYGYATLGELVAWIIGWDLILEYAVGAITVAIGWSGYVVSFLHDFGIDVPPALSAARGTELIELSRCPRCAPENEGWLGGESAPLCWIKSRSRALTRRRSPTSRRSLICRRCSSSLWSRRCWWLGLRSRRTSTT